uniref:Protein downstream neighbor of Son-like n=1 Tax=Nicotiana tabacum TaxID=4097 RepID=A0A1S4D8E1_TOBAC|nr:PREDICTED: uncharacterized protein LOC107827100 [Nicotiana tabacum]
MAKVAAAGPVHPSNALKFGGGGGSKVTTTTLKRKTPSELRGEQLKRKETTQLVDESSAPIGGSMSNGVFPGSKISDVSKNPRYVDTRVDELFPVRKNSIRLNLISRKENVKESFPAEQSGSIKKSSVPSAFPAENQQQLKFPESFLPSTVSGKDCATKTCSTSQRCNENTFRSVTELSLGGVDAHGLSTIDMDKALRGLATHEHQVASAKIAESSEPDGGLRSKIFSSELQVPCKMTPLDLTMKTNIRVVSASSINWFHRLINCGTSNVVARFTSSNCSTSQKMTCFSEMNSVSQAVNHRSLHSWMYPQSPLPPSVISALTLSASTGGQLDFLSERQLAWQDSFRSLYYMLRKNVCSIFYVCTAQFVVMFTSSYSEENCVCNAYISQSTRGLRSSLKEHVRLVLAYLVSAVTLLQSADTMLLNYIAFCQIFRYFLTSLTGVDVPVLYSPIPFENAAFTAPEVRCKEVRRIDQVAFQGMESNVPCEHNQQPSSGMCYSVEIKGRYLAPWVTSAICDTFSSNSTSFEASFITEPTSVGLNACLSVSGKCSDPQVSATEALDNGSLCFGIPNTKLCAQINSAFLKGVKYFGSSYTAFLSPV